MQIGHSEPRWTIPSILIANSLSLLLYNVAGMFVTEEMGAVSRTVFESARTLFVWLGDLLLYYTHTGLGEKWDNSSYLQVCHMPTLSSSINDSLSPQRQFCSLPLGPGWLRLGSGLTLVSHCAWCSL